MGDKGVSCPACFGECHLNDAVSDLGDSTRLCPCCAGSGHVPAKWAAMYAYARDKTCDYCGKARGAAWDGELFTCVECWEAKHGNQ